MSSEQDMMRLLGSIDGKLDQALAAAKEHRDDDNRRFKEVFNRLDVQDAEINKAKGAKGAILWVFSIVAGSAGALLTYFLKAKGGG